MFGFSGVILQAAKIHCVSLLKRQDQFCPAHAGGTMGKSRKRSRHSNTGYPYSVRVAHIHVVRPKVRRQSDSSLFIGDCSSTVPLFCCASALLVSV